MTSQSDEHRQPVSVAVAVLAAGHGTRMKSAHPKHVHPVAGIPIVERIVRAAQHIDPDHICVVVSPTMTDLPSRLRMDGEFGTTVMEVPTGTAHAVLAAIEAVPEVDYIISLLGDNPLLTGETIQDLLDRAITTDATVTVLSCILPDAEKYGRIDRNDDGNVTSIVEAKNDDPAKRVGETEINSGIMVLKRDWALKAIPTLALDPGVGEYILTDLVSLAASEHQEGEPWPVQAVPGDINVSVGINHRVQQAEADAIVRKQMREKHMLDGVSMVGPETIFIDESVEIGQDTTLLPGTILMGKTTIGTGCTVGPYAVLTDVTVGDNVTIRNSTVESSTICSNTDVGPYAHIRGESHIGEHVHIGSYAELKNARLDNGVKSGHFSYLGDVHIGENTNIGAGTITANFDGVNKNHTEIGKDVFIGSDTILVAPVEVEEGARTGAGSVVTKPVMSGQTVVGVPARPIAPRIKE
ncbi:MAG: bifunctional UDP-N-acetylglucosamine diphosphorylase/glucosamine-1-phosphate N-acetyltransferase GlmU [Thermomicrobiales bacterium]|nr:bifunctional UDP-N-acetylglucosamine diphosphorylase/glucosamine-1-phosphate N-acetyltransferase GlmU [Thermomicrobiales bacterium]MCO5218725.1 bifunctional UDP-N-acetylglucosamine diphosphorylase/glucosamine-1-phosphate N-acetyltransferase GlmU [Thermomicrobiales bacterium]MCO5225752.1 bifunctional UDP-N-acetylglucosamine diphosphorylase/glucosamine-1-phosphate N-acetyltransferase GlmU [Thermomicrobiales bacterium]